MNVVKCEKENNKERREREGEGNKKMKTKFVIQGRNYFAGIKESYCHVGNPKIMFWCNRSKCHCQLRCFVH